MQLTGTRAVVASVGTDGAVAMTIAAARTAPIM
jgi:hypothetical protein